MVIGVSGGLCNSHPNIQIQIDDDAASQGQDQQGLQVSRARRGNHQRTARSLQDLRQQEHGYGYGESGEIDARELKAIMKAFGMEVRKQEVRDIYAELGKEIKEGLNFN